VAGLPAYLRDHEIMDIFKKYGPIKNVHLMTHPETQKSVGVALLEFDGDPQAAGLAAREAVLREHFSIVAGDTIRVMFDRNGIFKTFIIILR
jgi:RNA recognition motif-containing protein